MILTIIIIIILVVSHLLTLQPRPTSINMNSYKRLLMLLYYTVRSCKYVARFVSSFTGCTSHHSYAPNGAQVRSALGVKRDLKAK